MTSSRHDCLHPTIFQTQQQYNSLLEEICTYTKRSKTHSLKVQYLEVRPRLGPAQRLDHHGHAADLGHLAIEVPLFAGGLGSDLRRAGGRKGERETGDGGKGREAMGVARGDERRNEKVKNLRKEARARYGGG